MIHQPDFGGINWIGLDPPRDGRSPRSLADGSATIIARIGVTALRGYKGSGLYAYK